MRCNGGLVAWSFIVGLILTPVPPKRRCGNGPFFAGRRIRPSVLCPDDSGRLPIQDGERPRELGRGPSHRDILEAP